MIVEQAVAIIALLPGLESVWLSAAAVGVGAFVALRRWPSGLRLAMLLVLSVLAAQWAVGEARSLTEGAHDAVALSVATILVLAALLLATAVVLMVLSSFGPLRDRWLPRSIALMAVGASPLFFWALFRVFGPVAFMLGE